MTSPRDRGTPSPDTETPSVNADASATPSVAAATPAQSAKSATPTPGSPSGTPEEDAKAAATKEAADKKERENKEEQEKRNNEDAMYHAQRERYIDWMMTKYPDELRGVRPTWKPAHAQSDVKKAADDPRVGQIRSVVSERMGDGLYKRVPPTASGTQVNVRNGQSQPHPLVMWHDFSGPFSDSRWKDAFKKAWGTVFDFNGSTGTGAHNMYLSWPKHSHMDMLDPDYVKHKLMEIEMFIELAKERNMSLTLSQEMMDFISMHADQLVDEVSLNPFDLAITRDARTNRANEILEKRFWGPLAALNIPHVAKEEAGVHKQFTKTTKELDKNPQIDESGKEGYKEKISKSDKEFNKELKALEKRVDKMTSAKDSVDRHISTLSDVLERNGPKEEVETVQGVSAVPRGELLAAVEKEQDSLKVQIEAMKEVLGERREALEDKTTRTKEEEVELKQIKERVEEIDKLSSRVDAVDVSAVRKKDADFVNYVTTGTKPEKPEEPEEGSTMRPAP